MKIAGYDKTDLCKNGLKTAFQNYRWTRSVKTLILRDFRLHDAVGIEHVRAVMMARSLKRRRA